MATSLSVAIITVTPQVCTSLMSNGGTEPRHNLNLFLGHNILGVVNGKIRDSPRRRDPCLKIRARDFNDFRKSEPETQCREIRARDFINRAKTNRVGEATISLQSKSCEGLRCSRFSEKKKKDRGMRERAQGPRHHPLAPAVNEFPRFSYELDM